MRRPIKTLLFAAAIAVTGMASSGAPASAAPDNPCELAFSFVCRFVPIAPELDGDIDLSTQLPPAPPDEPLPPAAPDEPLPPVNICAQGCM